MPQDSRIAKRRQAALDAGSPEYVQRRAELIAAAARAFEAKGYDRTSFNDIAENAGIDRASLYYYVGNKSDLFDAVAITPAEANIRAIEEIRSSDLDPVGKLRAAIEQLMSSFDEHFPYLYIYIRENLGTIAVDAARRTKMQEIQERYNAAFVDIIREGQTAKVFEATLPPGVLAFSIVGMLAWSHNWFRPDGPISGGAIGIGLADMVISGLQTGPPARAKRPKPR